MKSLVAVFTGLGLAAGIVVGVLTHGRSPGTIGGYTFYADQPRRYADYLPVRHPWLPGLAEYAGTGLVVGLLIALLLGAIGFRLNRPIR